MQTAEPAPFPDTPSFTIDVLPVDAFEALLVVCSWMGEMLVDDPPYVLEAFLHDPEPCWCRLDLVPDAGATTVLFPFVQNADEARRHAMIVLALAAADTGSAADPRADQAVLADLLTDQRGHRNGFCVDVRVEIERLLAVSQGRDPTPPGR